MNELQIRAILTGIAFGLWPLFMNRSGLSGNMSSFCFSMAVLIGVLPFALYSNGLSIPSANWWMVLIAGLISALGVISFNGMLAKAQPVQVGTLLVLMTVIQITVAATYQVIMSGSVTPSKVCGYVFAGLAAYLLLRSGR